jgi:hypothetical protein
MTTLGILLAVVAAGLSLVGGVMFLMAAFRVSLKWGLLVLLVPFAGLVFVFAHWAEAKKGFLISLAGGVLSPIAAFVLVSGAMAGMGQQMAEQMAQQMEQEMARQMQQADAPSTAAVETGDFSSSPSADFSANAPVEPGAPGEDLAPEPEGYATANAGPIPINPLDSMSESDPVGSSVQPAERLSIPVAAARSHVGERLEFVRTDGRIFRAELIAVEGGVLRIKRDVPGGTMVYPVRRSEIAKLRSSP